MNTPKPENGWFTRERVLTVTLALATLLFVYLCFLLIETFIPAIAFALALAVATHGPYVWLRGRIRNNTVAAVLATLLVALLIIGPAAFLGAYLVQKGAENVNELRSGVSWQDWRATLSQQPVLGPALDWSQQHLDLEAQIQTLGEAVASRATGFLSGSVAVVTQLGITLFVLFFLYRDEKAAKRALFNLVPLSHAESDQLFSTLSATIRATVNGSFVVALVQAVAAGIMYVALGVPGAALWASLTLIAALVPVFGTVLIWGPVAIYLLVTASWIKAAILVAWGIVAIGTLDNILYPFLVGDTLRIHTVPTFFSILGGIAVFGPEGLILGPLILAVTSALLDIWWQRTGEGHSAEEEIADTPPAVSPPGGVLKEKS